MNTRRATQQGQVAASHRQVATTGRAVFPTRPVFAATPPPTRPAASATDHLTGLRNRRYLDKALARETALAERYGPATPCSIDRLLARADESMYEREAAPQPELPVRYESYLLRLRYVVSQSNGREERDGEPVCQVMLQGVASKEQRYFADLESLVEYLNPQGEEPKQRQRAAEAAKTPEAIQ